METYGEAAYELLTKPLTPSQTEELIWFLRKPQPMALDASVGDRARLQAARRAFRSPTDGSVEATDHAMMRLRFLRGMISIGRTEVRDAATGRRIGRTDPCIPMNIDPQETLDNIEAQMTRLEAERAARIGAPTIPKEPPSSAT